MKNNKLKEMLNHIIMMRSYNDNKSIYLKFRIIEELFNQIRGTYRMREYQKIIRNKNGND